MASQNSSRSSSAADSYIGSLISLTSKSEIRYEGVLYNINTDESSIGLKTVRSFGTEGRKNDGPQIPPSDKIYEYILFRGSDIKDLQVKSPPPVQPTPTINNDPAIIQSHYSRPVSSSPSLPSSVSGSLTDINLHNAQFGLPGSNVQGGFPLYQPGGVLGSWGPSPPPPNANGSGLAIPMYWQGYYGPANGLTHLPQQPPLLQPPSGMSIPSPMQQSMHYPSFNASLPGVPSNLLEVPSSLPSAASASSSNLNSTSVFSSTLPSTLSSTIPLVPSTLPSTLLSTIPPMPSTLPLSSNVPPVPSTTLASATLLSGPNKAQNSALSASNVSGLPSLSPLSASNPETKTSATSISNKANTVAGSTFSNKSVSQPSSSVVGTSSSSYENTPSLVIPGQFLQSGSAAVLSSLSSQSAEKNVELVQVSSSLSEVSMPVSTESQPPILPLPPSVRAVYKPNGASFQPRHGYRGRGRGTGNSRPMTKFTEEFDFMAMNEKFNKDEVWGNIGKSNKSHPKDKVGDEKISDDDDYQDDDDDAELLKPVYNKDDFFDTLSSNALYQESQNGRTRYSEQMKIDTETFGEFTRYPGGRGGHGPWRGGRSRGGYYERGYGYVGRGRGRGRAVSSRAQY